MAYMVVSLIWQSGRTGTPSDESKGLLHVALKILQAPPRGTYSTNTHLLLSLPTVSIVWPYGILNISPSDASSLGNSAWNLLQRIFECLL